MTVLTAPNAAPARTADLAVLLRVDAGVCAVTGLLAGLDAAGVADALGPDVPTTAVRVVGVALLVLAADLALLSRASRTWRRRAAAAAGAGNLAWELATLVLVATGAFSVGGAVGALALAALLGALGVLQLRAARR